METKNTDNKIKFNASFEAKEIKSGINFEMAGVKITGMFEGDVRVNNAEVLIDPLEVLQWLYKISAVAKVM